MDVHLTSLFSKNKTECHSSLAAFLLFSIQDAREMTYHAHLSLLGYILVISVACLLCAWLTICSRDASNLDQNVVERLFLNKLWSSYKKPINLVQLGISLIPHICLGGIPRLHGYSRNTRNVAKTAQCSDARFCSCGLQHMDTWCRFLLASWQNWICIQCSFHNRPSIPKLVTVEIWG